MKKIDLTEGNILKILLIVAVPSIISGLLQFTYNIVDMFILGQALGTNAISGVGSATVFIGYGVSVISLVVNGVGVRISHSLGSGNKEDYYKYLNAAYFLYAIIAVFFFLMFTIFTNFTLSFLNIETEEVYNNAYTYLKVYGFVNIFAFLNTIYTRVLTSSGLSKAYMVINSIGVIINLFLDILLVWVFDFGVFGAVVATLIAQFIMTAIFFIKYKENLAYVPKNKVDLNYAKDIFNLGVPYCIQRLFFTFISMLIARELVSLGDEAMAAQRLGLQIETVTLLVTGGIMSAVSAFVGQNFGAQKYDRINLVFKDAIVISEIYALLTSSLFLIFSEEIAGLFVNDALTIEYTAMYLKYIAYGQFFAVLEMLGNAFYNGIGKPKIPTYISVTITPLRLVFAMVLSKTYGVEAVFFGVLFTTILKGIISYGYYLFFVKAKVGVSILPKQK
ncbi:MAG: MATE family efflux transporter [Lachnospirales bacterium]